MIPPIMLSGIMDEVNACALPLQCGAYLIYPFTVAKILRVGRGRRDNENVAPLPYLPGCNMTIQE